MKTIDQIVSTRNHIAKLAIDGSRSYAMEAIGEENDDINNMESLTGMPRVHRATSDCDVAVYADGERWLIVADCNGPIAIGKS
jgi:hypothetical protein